MSDMSDLTSQTGGLKTLKARDGTLLFRRDWPCQASGNKARGTIVIVHGLGEHSGRYDAVASFLVEHRWHVVGYDHRGHGRSKGARGRLAHEDDLLFDLALVVDAVRAERSLPVVLLGHSLGGLVAARFVAGGLRASGGASAGAPDGAFTGPADAASPLWWRLVDALVLSSPALDIGMSKAQKALLAVLGPLAPNLAVGNGLKPEWLSHDAAVVAAYRADPLVHHRIAPRLARFMAGAGPEVLAAAPRWVVPTLLIYAGGDRCVAPAGSAAFAADAPPGVVSHRRFANLFHEIFNEPERYAVLAVLADWLDTLTFPMSERTLR